MHTPSDFKTVASLGAAVVSFESDIDFFASEDPEPGAPTKPTTAPPKSPEFGSALRLLLTCTTCRTR